MKKMMRNKSSFWGMIVAAVLMVLICASAFEMQVQAEGTGKVTVASVNVRKKADQNSDKVGGLLRNETFVIKDETTGADGKTWYLIEYGEGKEGYVRSDLVSVDGASSSGSSNTSTSGSTSTGTASEVTKLNPVSGTVTGSKVNIRAKADANSAKVTSVTEDTVLTITGQATGADNKVWYQVTFISENKEIQGFIRSDYVDPAGNLTPYTEPVKNPEPSTTPETPSVQEPSQEEPPVEVSKDWDTVQVDGQWTLVENSSGKYYVVNDLIQISKENAQKLEEVTGTVKGQKVAIVILVLLLIIFGAALAFIVFRFKDIIMEELLGMKAEPAPVRRPEGQRRPVNGQGRPAQRPGQRPAQRPAGAQGQGNQRPVAPAQRAAGGPEQRPGQRPAGAPGQRPGAQGQGAVQRPAGSPAQKPVGAAKPAGAVKPAEAAKPVGAERVAPAFDVNGAKEEQIRQETSKSLENKQMERKVALNDTAKKPKNFMTDEDEFEFEFLNWDGEDEE
ncbi:MAG: SH3 domain-containing protein [Lachnospiraceae bacterium]|nr:SH3 domain-containing protein [Lachnospiraceae bacterium]